MTDTHRVDKVQCLIVDDREENLIALRALLAGDDVDLLEARSGDEALEILLTHDIALAILDVQMPGMDGFELAEMMRGSERTRDIPLIFVTAAARDQHRLFKGYEAGAVDFLYKPIEPRMLRSKAAVFFELHRQRRELARELRERSETLRLSEIFTAVLGHDLRNPLSAIVTCAEILRRSDDAKMRLLGERINDSGQRMRRMIDSVLDLTRARLGGGIALALEAADLRKVVDAIVVEHRASHVDRRIEVRYDGDLTGLWDVVRLSQLVSNLVGNALQHGDPSSTVVVSASGTAPDCVRLAVENGGTIPRALLPSLFEPFRAHSGEARNGGGLGLGLYIAREIVRAHQGRIDVVSDADERVRFNVELPRHPPR